MRLGGDIIFKKEGARLKANQNPMLLFDYRCYVPGRKLGTQYTPQLKECLTNISSMTPGQIKTQYGFPKVQAGKILHRRAKGGRRCRPGWRCPAV
jgi:hypothetical protein